MDILQGVVVGVAVVLITQYMTAHKTGKKSSPIANIPTSTTSTTSTGGTSPAAEIRSQNNV